MSTTKKPWRRPSLLSLRRPLLESIEVLKPNGIIDWSNPADVLLEISEVAKTHPAPVEFKRRVLDLINQANLKQAEASGSANRGSLAESFESNGQTVLTLLGRKRNPGLAAALDAKARRESKGNARKESIARRPFAPVGNSPATITDLQESFAESVASRAAAAASARMDELLESRKGNRNPRKVPSLRNLRRG